MAIDLLLRKLGHPSLDLQLCYIHTLSAKGAGAQFNTRPVGKADKFYDVSFEHGETERSHQQPLRYILMHQEAMVGPRQGVKSIYRFIAVVISQSDWAERVGSVAHLVMGVARRL